MIHFGSIDAKLDALVKDRNCVREKYAYEKKVEKIFETTALKKEKMFKYSSVLSLVGEENILTFQMAPFLFLIQLR